MKKNLLLFFVVLLAIRFAGAQNIEPGGGAKGLVDLKNTSVDYSTGVFNYTIPLFELSSSKYKLPVALAYSARGVKVNDVSGPYGHGWSLLCGGVITRMVRGGIEDDARVGFLNKTLAHTDSIERQVHTHRHDGESDIYTAIFNGRQISFITLRENGKTVVKPLEKTDLRITTKPLAGWEIIDEQGVRYVFNNIELSDGVCVQDGNNTTNDIWNKSFASSWHLSEIQIPGDNTIYFNYDDGKPVSYTTWGQIGYNYGRRVRERNYNIDRYRGELNENIANAKYLVDEFVRELRHKHIVKEVHKLPTYVQYLKHIGSSVINGIRVDILKESEYRDFEIGMIVDMGMVFNAKLSERVLGCLADWGYSMDASALAMTKIREAINLIETADLERGTSVALKGCLEEVLKYMGLAIENIEMKETRYVNNFSCKIVRERQLRSVKWGPQEIVFNGDNKITGIQLINYKQDIIKEITFSYNLRNLKRVIFGGSGDSKHESYDFTYYLDTLKARGSDVWGFHNGHKPRVNNLFPFVQQIYDSSAYFVRVLANWPSELPDIPDRCVRRQYTKAFSLERITHSNGGSIYVDYESNTFKGDVYAGIRVKDLIRDDGDGNRDTIRYHYRDLSSSDREGSGVLAVGYQSLVKVLDYREFQDEILLTNVLDDEMAIVNRGNNGIFYNYVVEEFVGKGYQTHYFLVPQSFSGTIRQRSFYPYWLYGLPLGTALYDQQGRLLKISKNRYSSALVQGFPTRDCGITTSVKSVFFSGTSLYPFSSFVEQLKPYRFVLDKEDVLRMMPNEEKILYWNGYGYIYFNPYKEFYLPNMEPRENMVIPDQYYKLYYGGKSVLLGVEEREFFGVGALAPGLPSIADFTRSSYPGNSSVTTKNFVYGSLSRVQPTTVVTKIADGTEYKQENRVVADILTGESDVQKKMRLAGMSYLPVKTSTFVKPAGESVFLLTDESVMVYTDTVIKDKSYYLPEASYKLTMDYPLNINSILANNVFSLEKVNYREIQRWFYAGVNEKVEVVENRSLGKNEVCLYDDGTGNCIATANNVPHSAIAALDKYRVTELKYLNVPTSNRISFAEVDSFIVFHSNFLKVHRDTFLRGKMHQNIVKVVKAIINGEEYYGDILNNASDIRSVENEYEMFWRRNKTQMTKSENDYFSMVGNAIELLFTYLSEPDKIPYILNYDKLGIQLPDRIQVDKAVDREYDYRVLIKRLETRDLLSRVSWSVTYAGGIVVSGKDTCTIPAGQGFYCVKGRIPVNVVEPGRVLPKICLNLESHILSTILCPVGTWFELMSLDSKGRVVCRINPNGIVETIEYDGLGRVLRVRDRDGNLMKEFNYNVLVNN